jgi:hypothetical protein
MRKVSAAILIACTLTACESHSGTNQNAIQALGSTVPASRFDKSYWHKEHDTNTPDWLSAKRLCGQTVLANYPNCLPINDIVEADQRSDAEHAAKTRAKGEQMFQRGYEYDYLRKSWLLIREMQLAACLYTDAYPNDVTKVGIETWQCPSGTVIPKGIPDPRFSERGN